MNQPHGWRRLKLSGSTTIAAGMIDPLGLDSFPLPEIDIFAHYGRSMLERFQSRDSSARRVPLSGLRWAVLVLVTGSMAARFEGPDERERVSFPKDSVFRVCGVAVDDPVSQIQFRDGLINYRADSDHRVVEIYGNAGGIGPYIFKDGDEVALLLEVLGEPTLVLPSTLTDQKGVLSQHISFKERNLEVFADETGEVISGGFYLRQPRGHKKQASDGSSD